MFKIVAIYDNGGKTADRYTVVTNNRIAFYKGRYTYDALSLSEDPYWICYWCQCIRGPHLGKKIKLTDLSETLQNKIKLALH
jgi:hypothetical protein